MGIARSIFEWNPSQGDRTYQNTGYQQETTDVDELIAEYRRQANDHRKQYREFSGKAKNAYDKGRGADAHTFSELAHDHKDEMEEADQRAVELLIQKQQALTDNGELDLHGFYVNEAIDLLKSTLEKLNEDDNDQLTVITGKGLHSSDGVAKIRPAVINYLNNGRYRYALSPGVITVDNPSARPRRKRDEECCIIS